MTDDWQPWNVKHNLLEIVVMTICAVIAGCDVWEDIFEYCRVKEKRVFSGSPAGTPKLSCGSEDADAG